MFIDRLEVCNNTMVKIRHTLQYGIDIDTFNMTVY